MLLFIEEEKLRLAITLTFQYISCYSLSLWEIRSQRVLRVSIHLMLLFIQKVAEGSGEKCKFQYISCYSLSGMQMQLSLVTRIVSIHLMLLFITVDSNLCAVSSRFNTSHVTLYQKCGRKLTDPESMFQYISCYSLSFLQTIKEIERL